MLTFGNGVRLVQSTDEIPWHLIGCHDLFLDFETSSGDPKLDSLNPWHHCYIAGACITADNEQGSWYIPVGHTYPTANNLPWEPVYDFISKAILNCTRWINHNVKYDAQVASNILGLEIPDDIQLVDTIVLAKLLDSDRGYGRGTYELKSLSEDWIGEDIGKYEHALTPYLKTAKGDWYNRDYGQIPIDVMAEYGGQDVITNRRLFKYVWDLIPDDCEFIRDVEIQLTTVLYQMERNGLCINLQELQQTELVLMHKMQMIMDELQEIVGYAVQPHVTDDCHDILCGFYAMPVLERNELTEKQIEKGQEEGNASFAKDVLKKYLAYPGAPRDVIRKMLKYRTLHTLNALFVTKYQEHHVDEVLHPSFNQVVRTGRMSCKQPNAHQLSKAAKALIHPKPGYSFISIDYSQIEFRLIVHYIENQKALQSYAEDPFTDFHNWVRDMCIIPRSPAKTCNFLMGYGGGKKKLIAKLAEEETLIDDLSEKAEDLSGGDKVKAEKIFKRLCAERGESVYDRYHKELPELKRTSYAAATTAKLKGYVKNLYKRRRHLPQDRAHIAFNTVNQASAADLMKERTVEAYKMCKGTPVELLCNVHDEILFQAPTEIAEHPQTQIDLMHIMENPAIDLKVPIKCAIGVSSVNWKEAASKAIGLNYDSKSFSNFRHLHAS